ncbi:hypothetical protein SEA_OGOPOGO_100 [Mycobacterium phage Ogopogo]|nr:hypothetical protein SEA_OGOPOGO_100 [Mycobacterium phage Ogopogo]
MNRREIEDLRTKKIHQRLIKGRYTIGLAPNGYSLTQHACERMIARRIHMDWVMDALDSPARPSRDGAVKHVGLSATVVVNHPMKRIVTVGYGLFNNPTA